MKLTAFLITFLYFSISMNAAITSKCTNKTIPESIKEEALIALSFYPELVDTDITFEFKDNIKKSTMQAQPRFSSFFKGRKHRAYVVRISRMIQIDTEELSIDDVPSDVLIGWLGHELGHILDYIDRSTVGMMIFGINYIFSASHIREAERTADTFAIKRGMGDYILKTKNFILDHANISKKYKEKLRKLYLSPEDVLRIINEDSN